MKDKITPYRVYIKVDTANLVTSVNSSAFLFNTFGWVEIDSGYGDKYCHAQGNYFPKPIEDGRGVMRYRAYTFVDAPPGEPVARFFKYDDEYLIFERTQEEMDADYSGMPPPPQSDKERIAQLEAQNVMLTECILEMSGMIYA